MKPISQDSVKVWHPGDVVIQRYIAFGRVCWAIPAFCVSDDDRGLILFTPHGVRSRVLPTWGRPRSPEKIRSGEDRKTTRLEDRGIFNNLLFMRGAGRPWSVWCIWEQPTWRFLCYYVNFETPYVRNQVGIDVKDHELDIVVDRDHTWRYKDSENLEAHREAGLFSEAEVIAVRHTATEFIGRIEKWESPFCDGWDAWRPPDDWGLPMLREGWQTAPIASLDR